MAQYANTEEIPGPYEFEGENRLELISRASRNSTETYENLQAFCQKEIANLKRKLNWFKLLSIAEAVLIALLLIFVLMSCLGLLGPTQIRDSGLISVLETCP